MASPQLDPGKIKRPIQMLAVLIVGLVLLVGMFLTAGAKIETPSWARTMFFIAAIGLVPFFVGVVILMWTKFRVYLQDDPYYSEWLKRQEKIFRGFRAENVASPKMTASVESLSASLQGEERRIRKYEENQGIFLVHQWRPSKLRGQIADIVIQPTQHREGPLSAGLVESITYYLGPKFFGGKSLLKKNTSENFRLEISAYGPVLCLAELHIKGKKEPLVLERYVEFDDDD